MRLAQHRAGLELLQRLVVASDSPNIVEGCFAFKKNVAENLVLQNPAVQKFQFLPMSFSLFSRDLLTCGFWFWLNKKERETK